MRFLVLYEVEPVISKWAKARADFDLQKFNFRKAPFFVRDDGNKVLDIKYLLQQVDTFKYDGVIAVVKGNKLSGIWGCHNKVSLGDKRFSVVQVEFHKKLYREYVGVFGAAKLEPTKKKTPYYQPEYTFDHELKHAFAWLWNLSDLLHPYVRFKLYDMYKNNFPLKSN